MSLSRVGIAAEGIAAAAAAGVDGDAGMADVAGDVSLLVVWLLLLVVPVAGVVAGGVCGVLGAATAR